MYKLIITLHAYTHVLPIISNDILLIVNFSHLDQYGHMCDQWEYGYDHFIASHDEA